MFYTILYIIALWFAVSYGLLATTLLIAWIGRTRRHTCPTNEEQTPHYANW